MQIIKPSVEFFEETPIDHDGCLLLIERAARTCYNSEGKIGCTIRNPQKSGTNFCAEEGRWDDMNGGVSNCGAGCKHHSAGPLIRKLLYNGHTAMIEHSNFVVRYDRRNPLPKSKYLTSHIDEKHVYVGGNFRAWMESTGCSLETLREGFEDVEVCPFNEIPAKLRRYTAKFICDRGVSHELVRHRPCSFAQRSTRYCNEGVGGMKFVEPWWWSDELRHPAKELFIASCSAAETTYAEMIVSGLAPQAARAILPNALATEIWVTADATEWELIRRLRTAHGAHPDMQRLMGTIPWEVIK